MIGELNITARFCLQNYRSDELILGPQWLGEQQVPADFGMLTKLGVYPVAQMVVEQLAKASIAG